MGEDAFEHNDPGTGIISLNAPVYGGSYLGLGQVNNRSTFSPPGGPGSSITDLWSLILDGPASTTSPGIGLRCVRLRTVIPRTQATGSLSPPFDENPKPSFPPTALLEESRGGLRIDGLGLGGEPNGAVGRQQPK